MEIEEIENQVLYQIWWLSPESFTKIFAPRGFFVANKNLTSGNKLI